MRRYEKAPVGLVLLMWTALRLAKVGGLPEYDDDAAIKEYKREKEFGATGAGYGPSDELVGLWKAVREHVTGRPAFKSIGGARKRVPALREVLKEVDFRLDTSEAAAKSVAFCSALHAEMSEEDAEKVGAVAKLIWSWTQICSELLEKQRQ